MLTNFLLALSLTGQIIVAERKPEHDVVQKLTPEQQEHVNFVISSCQPDEPDEPDSPSQTLDCQMSYSELLELAKKWYPVIYDRPSLCDKFDSHKKQWSQAEREEFLRLECPIGDVDTK